MAEQTVAVPSEQKAPVAQEKTRAEDRYIAPPVDIFEDKEGLTVLADLPGVTSEALAPGVSPDKLDLTVQGTTLTISGEKPGLQNVKPEQLHRSERSAGRFVRTVELPYLVSDAGVAASYQNGLLLITLPRHEATKPKQIQVRLG